MSFFNLKLHNYAKVHNLSLDLADFKEQLAVKS